MFDNESGNIDAFIDSLPDPAGARVFLNRLEEMGRSHSENFKKTPLLLSRMLTLAGHSPFLAETLIRHPEHISWLETETKRGFDRVKSKEQLSEELARFVTLIGNAVDASRLARFKRRELLRIYLRDCLHIATLSEVTEELSNLADVILSYGLARASQEMVNVHGAPLTKRGRIENAEFAIVALGKLGCRELNYASDIDLLFLFSGNGETAGDGRNPESAIDNKEFFTGVAELVVQMIGRSSDEGAVYRIDLRLRPYGRDGDLVWETERAADYYRNRAHNWERQALIRARASAGSEVVMTAFLDLVRDTIFTRDALPDTLEGVRRAKEQIDRREAARMRGFNVKLGPGGIREIEFIAQALQLKHGGREPWVRSAQTLIVLARLAEKHYLTEPERTSLSAAYTFLRTVEHRLQMEHGAQTHTLPKALPKLELLARRCGYIHTDDPTGNLMRDLEKHAAAVRDVYNRVFIQTAHAETTPSAVDGTGRTEGDDETTRLIRQAAERLTRVAVAEPDRTKLETSRNEIEKVLASALPSAINPSRALRNLLGWTDSLSTYTRDQLTASGWTIGPEDWPILIERLVCVLSSQYLSHLLVSRPVLADALAKDHERLTFPQFVQVLRSAIEPERDSSSKTDALRRAWYRLVIEIGYRDISAVACDFPGNAASVNDIESTAGSARTDSLRENNRAQTALAEAVLRIATEIALESIGLGRLRPDDLPFAILGLGRLGHSGMDYGSDLDLLIVFDDDNPWPSSLAARPDEVTGCKTPDEFYARLASQIVRVLSSITQEGLLYRTDLRLRPEGKSGPVALGLRGFLAYITNRSSAWEHSAYLKAREVAGDLRFGELARKAICDASFNAASHRESLKEELRDIRERLEKEKARGGRPNIKWGAGGMTDVYFVTRYLQLRDRIYFPPEQGTIALIKHLGEVGSLDREATRVLFEGYTFLRRLDHWMRLLLDRPSPMLPGSAIALGDITRAMRLASVEEFEESFARHTSAIREVHEKVFG